MRGLFVTGTGTGVGKTVVAGAIAAAIVAQGTRVAVFKPVVTGLDEPHDPDWPADHELLAMASGGGQGLRRPTDHARDRDDDHRQRIDPSADDVAPRRFGPAVSPHLAADLAGEPLDPAELVAAARAKATTAEVIIAEGVGGLLVPLTLGYSVRDLALDIGLPLVIVARPGLGTINHTLLTVEAARAVGLEVAGIVMTPWPADPSGIQRSNRDTVARLAGVEVSTLPQIARAEPQLLAAAGDGLPLTSWLG